MRRLTCLEFVARAAAGVAIGLSGGAAASAQTVTSGNSAFVLLPSNTTGAGIRTGTEGGVGAGLVAGGDATDQLFQQWWWYRVQGVNTREVALSNRVSNTAFGSTLTATYSEPEGFTAIVRYVIADGGDAPAACFLSATVTLQTASVAPLNITLIGYVDLDLEGAPFDGATLLGGGRIRVADQGTGFFAEITAPNATAYQVGAYPTVRDLLTDDDIDNLGSGGLPMAPGDFSGAVQWNVTISQGHPASLPFSIALNTSTDPCPGQLLGDANCDGLFNNFDIDCFVTAIVGGEPAWNSGCNAGGNCGYVCVLDVNRDGRVDNFDIDPFVTCVVSLGCP